MQHRSHLIIWTGFTVMVVRSVVCYGQLSEAPAFEVASVRAVDPKSASATVITRGGPGSPEPGQVSYKNITLKTLLVAAYQPDCRIHADGCDQIIGPAWLNENRYDISAKLPALATSIELRLMLQSLLATRFHLELHHEVRQLPGYNLVAGKVSRQLVRSADVDSSGTDLNLLGPLAKMDTKGYPRLLRPGFLVAPFIGAKGPANHLIAREQTFSDIAQMLGTLLKSHVVDKTGILGKYDFTLDWVPDGVLPADLSDSPDSFLPSNIPTAVQAQLGLKLMPTKLALDIIVVDNAEKVPTDN